MTGDIASVVTTVFTQSLTSLLIWVPQFIAGLVILLIGMFTATLLKRAIEGIFGLVMFERWVEKARLAKASDVRMWQDLLVQIVRWAVVILFLVPALETWGIPKVTEVLNQLLVYLPRVFVSAVVGFLGIVIANLTYEVVRHGARGLGTASSGLVAGISRYGLLFFTGLVVLHQLGVAQELIQILFTGIVAMLALAGGLAFGLGGQDTARDILRGVREKLEK